MKVTIKGRDFEARQTLRAMFIWEEIMKRPFELRSTLDNYCYFYSVILASNPDVALTWDEFVDAADADPDLVGAIADALSKRREMDAVFEDEETAKAVSGDPQKKN